jgi:lipopolysaccharide transport system permease protein
MRIIRSKYEQSVLGWLWAIAQPVAQVATFAVIFTRVVPVDTGGVPYPLFSYAAMTPWMFLSTSLVDMSGAIVDNLRLVTKIYFPREVLPIAVMLARFMDFLVALVLMLVLVLYYGVGLHPTLLWLPVLVLIQFAFTLGVGLAAAAANTFLRDVRPALQLVVQLWFYASPIIYPISAVPERLRAVYALNPTVGLLEGYRAMWLGQPAPIGYVAVSAAISLVCLLAGYAFFKRSEAVFADIA